VSNLMRAWEKSPGAGVDLPTFRAKLKAGPRMTGDACRLIYHGLTEGSKISQRWSQVRKSFGLQEILAGRAGLQEIEDQSPASSNPRSPASSNPRSSHSSPRKSKTSPSLKERQSSDEREDEEDLDFRSAKTMPNEKPTTPKVKRSKLRTQDALFLDKWKEAFESAQKTEPSQGGEE